MNESVSLKKLMWVMADIGEWRSLGTDPLWDELIFIKEWVVQFIELRSLFNDQVKKSIEFMHAYSGRNKSTLGWEKAKYECEAIEAKYSKMEHNVIKSKPDWVKINRIETDLDELIKKMTKIRNVLKLSGDLKRSQ